jgi:DNA-nicking Smr family endonuclease
VARRRKRSSRGAAARPQREPAPAEPGAERFADLIGELWRPPDAEAPAAAAPNPKRRARRAAEPAAVAFQIEREAERFSGLAAGGDRKQLRRLRRGEYAIERRIDLHGLDAAAARRALRAALHGALEAELRCLLVIHGRGLHSQGAPRLRELLPEWLAEAPHGSELLGFASARPEHGGSGACYVLLRRRRRMLGT